MANQKCRACGTENRKEYFLCVKCGAPLHDEGFSQELYALPALKLKRIVNNLEYVPHKPVPWDNKIDSYVRDIEKINAILRLPGMDAENSKDLQEKINAFYELCHNPDFQIAFVGTIKTGKSTLINALLGRNYASMEVTPETAALTKFRSSLEDFVKVSFYSREEWEKLWESRSHAVDFEREYNDLNAQVHKEKYVGKEPEYKKIANEDIEAELARWSSSKSPEHFFVKEIEVGISTLKGVPPQVVFVDTPGLSDPVAYRSEISRQYIKRANAVFVCVDAQKIQKEEIETIASVFNFAHDKKSKVYIIGTHWDKLNNPDEDWNKQKIFFEKQLTGPAFFESRQDADENTLHSAAYLYNLARDYPEITEREKKSLKQFLLIMDRDIENIESSLPFIKNKSNIAAIRKVIQDKLVENYKQLLTGDIRKLYKDIIYDVQRIVEEMQKELLGLLESSDSGLDEIRAQMALKKSEQEKINDALDSLDKLVERTSKKTEVIINKICSKLQKSFDNEKKS